MLQDIDKDDLQELTEYFIPLIKSKKIRVLDARTKNEQFLNKVPQSIVFGTEAIEDK